MVYIDFTVRFYHGADKVWAALTDWESHAQWIPFTRIIILDNGVDGTKGLGTIFIGRTGFGKLSFDDKMQVDRFLRPKDNEKGVGKVSIKKLSSFIKGSAAFQVCPIDENACEVRWIENLSLPFMGDNIFFNRAGEIIGAFLFRRSLNKLNKILT